MGLAHLFLPTAPDLANWFAEHGPAIVDAVGATTARLLRSTTGEQIIVVELDADPAGREPDVAALPLPPRVRTDLVGSDATDDAQPGHVDGVGWGLYRLDYRATPDGADVFHS